MITRVQRRDGPAPPMAAPPGEAPDAGDVEADGDHAHGDPDPRPHAHGDPEQGQEPGEDHTASRHLIPEITTERLKALAASSSGVRTARSTASVVLTTDSMPRTPVPKHLVDTDELGSGTLRPWTVLRARWG